MPQTSQRIDTRDGQRIGTHLNQPLASGMERRAQRHGVASGLDNSHVCIRHLGAIRLRIVASLVHGHARLGGTVLGLGMQRRGN